MSDIAGSSTESPVVIDDSDEDVVDSVEDVLPSWEPERAAPPLSARQHSKRPLEVRGSESDGSFNFRSQPRTKSLFDWSFDESEDKMRSPFLPRRKRPEVVHLEGDNGNVVEVAPPVGFSAQVLPVGALQDPPRLRYHDTPVVGWSSKPDVLMGDGAPVLEAAGCQVWGGKKGVEDCSEPGECTRLQFVPPPAYN